MILALQNVLFGIGSPKLLFGCFCETTFDQLLELELR